MLPAVTGLAASIDWSYILKTAVLIAAAFLIIGAVFCVVFGKDSPLVRATSACLSLVLVYLTAIVLYRFLPHIRASLPALPFITVTGDAFYLWNPAHLGTTQLFPSLLQLFILAFLVNILDTFLPKGEKLLSWYLMRTACVAVALGLYMVISGLVTRFASQVFGEWAGAILIGIWAFILLTAIVRAVVAVVLTVINPIIGGLYAFFFSNVLGQQFSKSILTTLLCLAILAVLDRLGLSAFAFESFSLASYGPACLIAMVALYLFGKLL